MHVPPFRKGDCKWMWRVRGLESGNGVAELKAGGGLVECCGVYEVFDKAEDVETVR